MKRSQPHAFRWIVPASDAGSRLDVFLAKRLPAQSRSRIKGFIQSKQVELGGKPSKPAQLLQGGEEVSVQIYPEDPVEIPAQALSLRILFEDNHLLVLDKAAEQVVHPGAGNREGTVVNALLHHCKSLSSVGGLERPGIVHRLDKGTSGVLLVAKEDAVHLALSQQFKDRSVEKKYLAFVWGRLRSLQGSIELPLGRSVGNPKMVSSRSSHRREAVTHYRVLRQWPAIALLELTPQTGRTHQIRVHLAEFGHAVVGDPVYGKGQRLFDKLSGSLGSWLRSRSFQLLHAASLGFTHPVTGQRMRFEAPIRPEMRELELALEKEHTSP